MRRVFTGLCVCLDILDMCVIPCRSCRRLLVPWKMAAGSVRVFLFPLLE